MPRASTTASEGARYLEHFLVPRFGLEAIELVSDRPRAQVFRARLDGQPIIVKIYDSEAAPLVRRSAALHEWLRDGEVLTPRVLAHDLGREAEHERGRVALLYSWQGHRPRNGHVSVATRALANLARIHRVRPPRLADLAIEGVTVEDGQRLEVAELRQADEPILDALEAFASRVRGSRLRVRDDDLARVAAWCRSAQGRLADSALPDTLLHGDYRPSNLVEQADGRLVTIDFDEAEVGPCNRELGLALLRCVWGTTSLQLTRIPLRALLRHPRLESAERAYLEHATSSVGSFWREHRETLLLAGYLRILERLAVRSGQTLRYRAPARAYYRSGARRGWRQLLQHLAA